MIWRRSLPFQQITCRCSAERQRAWACRDCGAQPDPREVDQLVARRRRIIDAARGQVSHAGVSTGVSLSLGEVIETCSVTLERIFAGLDAVLGQDREADAASVLAGAIAEIERLKTQMAEAPRRRPFTALWDATVGAVEGLDTALCRWLDALASRDMQEAQRLADVAQDEIDAASTPIGDAAAALRELDESLEGGSEQLLGSLAARVGKRVAAGPAGDPRTRPFASLPVGEFEHLLLFEDERARLVFDRDRYWAIVLDTHRQLCNNPAFERLVGDTPWRRRFLAAAEQISDAVLNAEAVANNTYHERRLARADLDVVKTVIEGPARTLLRSRLAIDRRRSFTQVKGDARSILDQAEQAGMEGALLGLDKQLRDAVSHEEFDVEQGVLILHPYDPSERRMAAEELADTVLAALESVVALHTGFTIALMAVDEDLALEAGRHATSPEQACWLGLHLAGHQVDGVAVHRNQVDLTLVTTFNTSILPALAGMAWLLDDAIEEATLTDGDGDVLEGPLSVLRKHGKAEDELEKEILLWKCFVAWRLNGAPVAGRRLWRCWATTLGVHSKDTAPREAIPRLRRLRRFASEVGDDELADFLGIVISFHKHRLLELPMRPRDIDRMMERAHAWGPRPTDWPPLLPS